MDIERDRATLLDLYLEGSITEDMLIDHLENRVGLYLGEMN